MKHVMPHCMLIARTTSRGSSPCWVLLDSRDRWPCVVIWHAILTCTVNTKCGYHSCALGTLRSPPKLLQINNNRYHNSPPSLVAHPTLSWPSAPASGPSQLYSSLLSLCLFLISVSQCVSVQSYFIVHSVRWSRQTRISACLFNFIDCWVIV